MKWPNLFIAGAPRCGTTSLYEYLKVHPSIFGPELKEPRYLAAEYIPNILKMKIDLIMTVTDEQQYLDLYKEGDNVKYRLDGSPQYMYYNEVAEKIKDISDDCKVLISLRNPRERILSSYIMLWNQGATDLDFKDYFRKEKEDQYNRAISTNSFYYYAVRNMFDVLGRERVHVIIFDNIVCKTAETLSGIYDFLGIEAILPEIITKTFNSNKKTLKNSFIRHMMSGKVAEIIYPRLSKSSITKIKNIIRENSRFDEVVIDDILKKEMLDYYIDDINKTEDLIGVDLSGWKV